MLPGDGEVSIPLQMVSTAASGGGMTLQEQVAHWFRTWCQPIYRSLLTAGASPSEAEDLTQEAFLRAFRFLHQGKTIDNPQFWLFRVAHNLWLDHVRSRRATADPSLDLPDWRPNPEQTAMQRERLAGVHRTMQRLTAMQRSCLNLRAEGFLHREIAEILGIGMSSVADALRRAIQQLAKDCHE